MKITKITARQILDSRGLPTIETDVFLENGIMGRAAVPSGASTGATEAVELRDKDPKVYFGKGVLGAVSNVNSKISEALIGQEINDQRTLDNLLIELDGTKNKANLGANAILSVSMGFCKASAALKNIPTFEHVANISGNTKFSLPRPMILLLEGGKHGNWSTDVQEYMIQPTPGAFSSFAETLRAGAEIFYSLEKVLNKKGYAVGVGFEGAYCPKELKSNEEAFELMLMAIELAGYKPKEDFMLVFDAAASEFYLPAGRQGENGQYILRSEGNKKITPREWTDKIISWTKSFPIFSIEDAHYSELWEEWTYLTENLGYTHQIVADDLVTTNVERIQHGIDSKSFNSVLIKLNQIGTVSETIDAVEMTHKAGFKSIISHRGGETNDDFAADFAVGVGAAQCKFGGPDRGERLAKYNQLLRIEEQFRAKV